MPRRCVVAGCSNETDSARNISIHTFPSDTKQRQIWEKQVQMTRAKWTARRSSHICSEHFEEKCFEESPTIMAEFGLPVARKRILKPGSIPTIFPEPSKTPQDEHENVCGKTVPKSAKRSSGAVRKSEKARKRLSSGNPSKEPVVLEVAPDGAFGNLVTPRCHQGPQFLHSDSWGLRCCSHHLPQYPGGQNANLPLCTRLSRKMMQSGVCVKQDSKTLPELPEQHRIREKEEELHGLESVHMAESETECTAPGLNTLEPECVTVNSRVSDLHHTETSVIKTEPVLGFTNSGDLIKTESLDNTKLKYVTLLNPQRVKMETDDGGYLKAEQISEEQDIKCVLVTCDQVKCEPTVNLVGDVMNTVMNEVSPNHVDLRINGGVKPYKCSHCGKCFSRVTNLNAHHRLHTGEKSYQYKHCEKCYPKISHINTHLRIHGGQEPYKCGHCGRCFSSESFLNRHQRSHTDGRPYKCAHCGKCFSTSTQLKGHHITHIGEKPHKCIHCGKCFSYKSQLSAHHRIHTGEKPYSCSFCGKSFSEAYQVNRHKRIHTGEKPYQCSHCGRCLSQLAHLIRHQRIHTGEKPYKCRQCERCFCSSSELNLHLKVHIGEKCIHCGMCHTEKSILRSHLRIFEN
ncbi:hypothetical protein GJAV_G00087370 [Gymnothorax javanicus]|nr:hypothetical protein GJAV_G00087370 [Gymnothorax javanicus]